MTTIRLLVLQLPRPSQAEPLGGGPDGLGLGHDLAPVDEYLFRRFLFLLCQFRRHDQGHVPAIHSDSLIDLRLIGESFNNSLKQFPTDFLVCHFAATEDDAELHFVSFGKELACVARLEVDVVRIRSRVKSHLLQLLLMLVLSLILFPLLLLVPEFSVINDLANGRIRLRGDLDKIELPLHCQLKGFTRGHDAKLLTLLVDDAQLGRADIAINSGSRLAWRTLRLFPNYCGSPEKCDADLPGRRIKQNSPQSYGFRAF